MEATVLQYSLVNLYRECSFGYIIIRYNKVPIYRMFYLLKGDSILIFARILTRYTGKERSKPLAQRIPLLVGFRLSVSAGFSQQCKKYLLAWMLAQPCESHMRRPHNNKEK